MNFQDSVKTCLVKKYCNFNGRASRSEYWWFAVAYWILGIVATVLDISIFYRNGKNVSLFSTILGLGLLLPSLGVMVRRLHDTNRSGWWILILIFLPIIVVVCSVVAGIGGVAMFIISIIQIIGFLVLMYFLIIKGTDGSNNFGPDPVTSDNSIVNK